MKTGIRKLSKFKIRLTEVNRGKAVVKQKAVSNIHANKIRN